MPDRHKKNVKKEKTNQYINETELKSLMIRINNKAFKTNLSTSFKRLKKYLDKLEKTSNTKFKFILEAHIVKCILRIVSNKYKQLLLLDIDKIKDIKKLIIDYNAVQHDITLYTDEYYKQNEIHFNRLIEAFNPTINEMLIKVDLLESSKQSDEARVKKYIKKHTNSKSQKFKKILKNYIILISERNVIYKDSYERFGEMVLLIIKNILKKPKFSGYTYRDEFYSDSTDKILRYLKNFNHKMISSITGQEVNAFSYLSQYVHNSILFIINTKSAEKAEVEKYVNTYNENIRLLYNETVYNIIENELIIDLKVIPNGLYDAILNEADAFKEHNTIKISYPSDYKISLVEYEKLKELNTLLDKTIQISRKRNN